MRKQTKLVAVLSAAALLALGASMTSFAAGWEKDEAGIWHYYDSSDDMVTGEWKKDGGKWFYLDDDGDMKTDGWVDDEYYVGSDGAMLVNAWYYGFGDDEGQDDPDDDGEHWYWFNSRGKRQEGKKKINGKTYYFTDEGKMRWGWYEEQTSTGSVVYYLGDENEGWRAENQWLWLEKSGLEEVGDEDEMNLPVLDCYDGDDCDDEGWYWFGSDGKMYFGKKQKKINGRYFMFNDHGQMLYEWINGSKVSLGSNWALDGKVSSYGESTIGQMKWYNPNGSDAADGSRGSGWQKIDGSDDVGTSDDTKWYYIDKGNAKHADEAKDFSGIYKDDGTPVFSARIKVDGKYFAFNENGEMQDGLQFIKNDTYYFNSDGYMQTGKQSNVEEGDDSTYNYYFTTKNAGNGKGITGEKNGYLYWKGKRCEAQDDYAIYFVDGYYWIVNNKGKLQKSDSKKYDIEQPNGEVVEQQFKVWTNKKKYKLATEESASEFIKENALVPFIQVEDTIVYANPADGVNALFTPAGAVTGDTIAKDDADSLPEEKGER